MMVSIHPPRVLRINWRLVSLLIASAGLVVVVAANAHLVYVAFASKPDCVPHVRAPGKDGMFRAARSVC